MTHLKTIFRTLKNMYLKKEYEREGCVVAYLLSFEQNGSSPFLFLSRLLSCSTSPPLAESVCVGVMLVFAKLGSGDIYRQIWCKMT